MGGLLSMIQWGRDWAGPQPAQAPPRCTKCISPTINGQCINFILFDVAFTLWRVKPTTVLTDVHVYSGRLLSRRSVTERVVCGLSSASARSVHFSRTPSFHIDPIRFDDFQLLLCSWKWTRPAGQRSLTRNGQLYFTIPDNSISFTTLFSPQPLYREIASQRMRVIGVVARHRHYYIQCI